MRNAFETSRGTRSRRPMLIAAARPACGSGNATRSRPRLRDAPARARPVATRRFQFARASAPWMVKPIPLRARNSPNPPSVGAGSSDPPKRTVSAGTIRGYAGRVAHNPLGRVRWPKLENRSLLPGRRRTDRQDDGLVIPRIAADRAAEPFRAAVASATSDHRAQHDGRGGERGPRQPRPPQERCEQTAVRRSPRGRAPVATSRWRLRHRRSRQRPASPNGEPPTWDQGPMSPATGPSRTWRARGRLESAAHRRSRTALPRAR